jgi:hypothetical protein
LDSITGEAHHALQAGCREGGHDRQTRGNLSSPNPNLHFGPFEAETGDPDQDLLERQDEDREVTDLKCLGRSCRCQHTALMVDVNH